MKTEPIISLDITKYKSLVSKQNREELHKHKGVALWFTGLSASGKSTIAHLLERKLYEMDFSTYVFDGDNVRHGLCCDLDFSEKDRAENVRRIGEMVNLFIDAGTIAIAAFISPFKTEREKVRAIIGPENFIEVFVDCPIELCIERDPKGIYKRALAGEIKEFTGISSPYESPDNPDIIIKTASTDFNKAAQTVVDFMKEKGCFI